MRSFLSVVALIAAAGGPGATSAAGAGFSLFRNYWGEVIVNTDVAEEGKALTPPSVGHPVYYLGRSLGARLGSIPGDNEPDAAALTKFATALLAKQGYLGAKPGVHEPTLYLVLQWGYLEPRSGEHLWFLGYNPARDIAAPSFPGMLGPEVFRRGFRSHEIETILDYSQDPLYGIIISAFEYQSANTPKPVILWQTRIGLPARGKSMAEALPTMLVAAGPAIGRGTEAPVLRDADSVREGHIKLGDLNILGIDEPATTPRAGPASAPKE